MPCDEHGDDIPPDTPPPPYRGDPDPDDWSPFEGRLQFETAEFIYTRKQMSAGDIDRLLELWSTSLFRHNDTSPFANYKDLYDTIDSIPLGDVKWESFTMKYNGQRPESDVPRWMDAEYDVWFRDPRTLIRNMISNPDFDGEFDYAPLQEYDESGHRYKDFMSGNWAWRQAVWVPQFYSCILLMSIFPFRIRLQRIPIPMAQHLSLLYLAVTRQLSLLARAITSIILSTPLLVISTIMYDVLIAMVWFSLAFYLCQKVFVLYNIQHNSMF
jgi:hypothetical protein